MINRISGAIFQFSEPVLTDDGVSNWIQLTVQCLVMFSPLLGLIQFDKICTRNVNAKCCVCGVSFFLWWSFSLCQIHEGFATMV